jgi:hypothetical protein
MSQVGGSGGRRGLRQCSRMSDVGGICTKGWHRTPHFRTSGPLRSGMEDAGYYATMRVGPDLMGVAKEKEKEAVRAMVDHIARTYRLEPIGAICWPRWWRTARSRKWWTSPTGSSPRISPCLSLAEGSTPSRPGEPKAGKPADAGHRPGRGGGWETVQASSRWRRRFHGPPKLQAPGPRPFHGAAGSLTGLVDGASVQAPHEEPGLRPSAGPRPRRRSSWCHAAKTAVPGFQATYAAEAQTP